MATGYGGRAAERERFISQFESLGKSLGALCGQKQYCTELGFPMAERKPKVIFVIGGPGSGKALQCEKMEERYGLKRLCGGDALCAELQSHGERGRFLRDLLETGRPLPEDTLLDLLSEAMRVTVRQGKGFLVSGFPRELKQAQDYDAKMGPPSAVFLLDCSAATMTRRLQQGTLSSLRASDACRRDARLRVESFCGAAVASHYRALGLLHKIDAELPPDEVFEQICLVLDSC